MYYPLGASQFLDLEEKEARLDRYVDQKASEKVNSFLYHVTDLFERFGVEAFDKYDGYDFDYALKKLREVAEKEVEEELDYISESEFDI